MVFCVILQFVYIHYMYVFYVFCGFMNVFCGSVYAFYVFCRFVNVFCWLLICLLWIEKCERPVDGKFVVFCCSVLLCSLVLCKVS